MVLEALRRVWMVEDSLERRVLERGTIDVTGDPIVVKDRSADLIVKHVVGGAGDTGVLPTRLPDELEQVIDARQNVVHEDDGVEDFALGITELVERHKSGVADFGEIFNAVIERATGAVGRANGNT